MSEEYESRATTPFRPSRSIQRHGSTDAYLGASLNQASQLSQHPHGEVGGQTGQLLEHSNLLPIPVALQQAQQNLGLRMEAQKSSVRTERKNDSVAEGTASAAAKEAPSQETILDQVASTSQPQADVTQGCLARVLVQTDANFQPYKTLFKHGMSNSRYGAEAPRAEKEKPAQEVPQEGELYDIYVQPAQSNMLDIIKQQRWLAERFQADHDRGRAGPGAEKIHSFDIVPPQAQNMPNARAKSRRNRTFAKRASEDPPFRLEPEEGQVLGPGNQIFFYNPEHKTEVSVIAPASISWKRRPRNPQDGGPLNTEQDDARRTSPMVDIRQIVYPPVESARRVRFLNQAAAAAGEPTDAVQNAIIKKAIKSPSTRPRSTSTKTFRQRLRNRSSRAIVDDPRSVYKMDSRAALIGSRHQLKNYNDDVLAIRAKLSQKPSLSSSRFQFNDLSSAMDPEKESAAAHLMHLNRLINQRSETTLGEPQTVVQLQRAEQLPQFSQDRRETAKADGDPPSAGMQSYSLFPQTARGVSFQFPRPQSSQQLVNLNKDLNNLQSQPSNKQTKSSVSSLKAKDVAKNKKVLGRYGSQQRPSFYRPKNINDYTADEFSDFLRYLKSDNYYDSLFAGRLQHALNAELEKKRKQILDTNEEDVKIKMTHPKQFNIRVKNLVLDEADGQTDAAKSPQAMAATQLKDPEYEERSPKPRTENLSSKHASEFKASDLRNLELNQAEQVKMEQVMNHPASPLSNIYSNELAKKTETTEAKDKNISIKDLVNEVDVPDPNILQESVPDTSSKSQLDKFIEHVRSEQEYSAQHGNNYANKFGNKNVLLDAVPKASEDVGFQEFGILPGFYILSAKHSQPNKPKYSDLVGKRFRPRASMPNGPLFEEPLQQKIERLERARQEQIEKARREHIERAQIASAAFPAEPAATALQNQDTGIGSRHRIFSTQALNSDQPAAVQRGTPKMADQDDLLDSAAKDGPHAQDNHTHIIFSQTGSKDQDGRKMAAQMSFYRETEMKAQLLQNQASDGQLINIRSQTSFHQREPPKRKQSAANSRERRRTYHINSSTVADNIFEQIQKSNCNLNPTILSPTYGHLVGGAESKTPQNIPPGLELRQPTPKEKSFDHTKKSARRRLNECPLISSRPFSASPGILYDGRSYVVRRDPMSLSTPKILSRQFSAISKYASPPQSPKAILRSGSASHHGASYQERISRLQENLDLLSRVVHVDQKSQSTDEVLTAHNDTKLHPMGIAHGSTRKDSTMRSKLQATFGPGGQDELNDYSQYAYEKYQRYQIYASKTRPRAVPRHQRSTSSFLIKQVPERIKAFDHFAAIARRLPHTSAEKYIDIDPNTSAVNFKDLSRSPQEYVERNRMMKHYYEKNGLIKVNDQVSQIWQYLDTKKPKVTGEKMVLRPKSNQKHPPKASSQEILPEDHQQSTQRRQDDKDSLNQREDDEELQITGHNPIMEDRRMLRLMRQHEQEKTKRQRKVLITSKAFSADLRGCVTPTEDSNRKGRGQLRPWSHHRESQKSGDQQPTMQTMKRTSSKGTVRGASTKLLHKDPFLNVVKPQQLHQSQEHLNRAREPADLRLTSPQTQSKNEAPSQIKEFVKVISNRKIESSTKIEASVEPSRELQRSKLLSSTHKKRENTASENLQEISRHSYKQLLTRPDGFEDNPSRMSYTGYIQQREERRLNASRLSGSRLSKGGDAQGRRNLSGFRSGQGRPDTAKHGQKSLNHHLDNLRRLQEIKRRRNRRVVTDVQTFLTSAAVPAPQGVQPGRQAPSDATDRAAQPASQLSMQGNAQGSHLSSVIGGVAVRRTSSVTAPRPEAEVLGRRKRQQMQEYKTLVEMREKIAGSEMTLRL